MGGWGGGVIPHRHGLGHPRAESHPEVKCVHVSVLDTAPLCPVMAVHTNSSGGTRVSSVYFGEKVYFGDAWLV